MKKIEKYFLLSGNPVFIGIGAIIYSIYNKICNNGETFYIIFWFLFIIMQIEFTITFNKINNLSNKIERLKNE